MKSEDLKESHRQKGKVETMRTNKGLTREEFKTLMTLLKKAKNEDDEILKGIQDLIELMRINKAIENK
jgi:hypothetical protein